VRYDAELAKMKSSVKEVESDRDALMIRTNERVNDLTSQLTRLNAQAEADKIALKAQVPPYNGTFYWRPLLTLNLFRLTLWSPRKLCWLRIETLLVERSRSKWQRCK